MKQKPIRVQIGRQIYRLVEDKALVIHEGQEANMIKFLTGRYDLRLLKDKEGDAQ